MLTWDLKLFEGLSIAWENVDYNWGSQFKMINSMEEYLSLSINLMVGNWFLRFLHRFDFIRLLTWKLSRHSKTHSWFWAIRTLKAKFTWILSYVVSSFFAICFLITKLAAKYFKCFNACGFFVDVKIISALEDTLLILSCKNVKSKNYTFPLIILKHMCS